MQQLTDNFFHKPLIPAVTWYMSCAVIFTVLATVFICGALLAEDANDVPRLYAVGLGVFFAILGLVGHAGLARVRLSFWNLLVHLLVFLAGLCIVFAHFHDVADLKARAILNFLELGVFGIAVGAVSELSKCLGSFARDLDPVFVTVKSLAFEFDRRSGTEILVVTCEDTPGEIVTPLRLVKTKRFQGLARGTRLRVTFKQYPNGVRQIANIDVCGADPTASS